VPPPRVLPIDATETGSMYNNPPVHTQIASATAGRRLWLRRCLSSRRAARSSNRCAQSGKPGANGRAEVDGLFPPFFFFQRLVVRARRKKRLNLVQIHFVFFREKKRKKRHALLRLSSTQTQTHTHARTRHMSVIQEDSVSVGVAPLMHNEPPQCS